MPAGGFDDWKAGAVSLWLESSRWRSLVTAMLAILSVLLIRQILSAGAPPQVPTGTISGSIPAAPTGVATGVAGAASLAATPTQAAAAANAAAGATSSGPSIVSPVAPPPMKIAPAQALRDFAIPSDAEPKARRPFATVAPTEEQKPAVRILD